MCEAVKAKFRMQMVFYNREVIMIRRYRFQIDEDKQNELDADMFEYAIDDYVWWEEKNQCLATDNTKVLHDLEELLAEHEIEYIVTEYE